MRSYRDVLIEAALANDDLDGRVIENSPVNMAVWRWDTLRFGLEYLLPAFALLRLLWNDLLFNTCRNRKLEVAARLAVHCDTFYQRFLIVYDLMIEISKLWVLAAGCPCHERERESAKQG